MPERHVLRNADRIQFAAVGVQEKRPDLRAQCDAPARMLQHVQGLDAPRIPSGRQRARAWIPVCKGVHAPELVDRGQTVTDESLNDHLGVRYCRLRGQAFGKLLIVVDLPVERERLTGRQHGGLLPLLAEADDRQARVEQQHISPRTLPDAVRVRPSVVERRKKLVSQIPPKIWACCRKDAAHGSMAR